MSGLTSSASVLTYSQRRTFGSRFCLMSPKGFIRNFSDPNLTLDDSADIWTTDVKDALQYASQDVAAIKLQAISHKIPNLNLKEVHYDIGRGQWIPVRA